MGVTGRQKARKEAGEVIQSYNLMKRKRDAGDKTRNRTPPTTYTLSNYKNEPNARKR